MELIVVPIMLFISSLLMAFAWIGHVRFRRRGFWIALLVSWLIVLPEYVLNVSAIRYGHGTYSGAQMASFNLSSGVVCVALVSRFFLKEPMSRRQGFGFALMAVAVTLISLD